jgi:hypothetical protein
VGGNRRTDELTDAAHTRVLFSMRSSAAHNVEVTLVTTCWELLSVHPTHPKKCCALKLNSVNLGMHFPTEPNYNKMHK